TLQPPINKEGGHLAILMRVIHGEIVPVEQRVANTRGSQVRMVPRELSAVAMKALARDPARRYPTVEALRQDIERFQEGRSVSAKDDTVREAVWKLVKRNKATSITAAVALIMVSTILVVSLRGAYREQQTKRDRGQKSAPLFFRDAKVSA